MKSQRGPRKEKDMTPVPQDPCIDCGKNWSMTQDEVDFWKRLCSTEGYKFPKRCADCRKKKKEMRNSAFSPDGIPARLAEIADKIEFGDFDEKAVSGELRALANTLKGFLKKGGRHSHGQTQETVEQSPQGASQ